MACAAADEDVGEGGGIGAKTSGLLFDPRKERQPMRSERKRDPLASFSLPELCSCFEELLSGEGVGGVFSF